MKRLFLMAALGASPVVAEDAASTLEAQVKQANANLFGAMVRRDALALERRVAEDAVFIGATVTSAATKAGFTARVLDPREPYQSIVVEDPRIKLQKDTAIVFGRIIVKGKTVSGNNHVKMAFTNVFARRNKRWQLILLQTGFATQINGRKLDGDRPATAK